MIILPLIAVALTHFMCVLVSITDIKSNRISNKTLGIFAALGVILNALQYVYRTHILWSVYVINLLLVFAFSIILYVFHIWAAGDSKLLTVLGIIIPANYCMLSNRMIPWSVAVVSFSFLLSFVYLIIESLFLFITKKEKISFTNVRKNFSQFLLAYVRNIIYISFILKLEQFFGGDGFEEHTFVILGINICIIVLISAFDMLKKKQIIIGVLLMSIVFSLITGEWFISFQRVKYYGVVVGIMIIRVLISEYNYKIIPTTELKRGMILSAFSTVLMQNSKVSGLPGLSREDMRSRLSDEEVEAVKRWGESKGGTDSVQIVRKIPYAIFIYLGFVLYSVLWRFVNQ